MKHLDAEGLARDRVEGQDMISRLGYLAPEFPGQTHAFFWREIRALEELGIKSRLISTKRPPARINVHGWAAQAQARTTYLLPLQSRDILAIMGELVGAGPLKIARCLKIALSADDCTWGERLRLCVMIAAATILARIMREDGVEHLHVQSCANSANLAMFASFLSGIPYSLSLLGPTLELYGPNQRSKWRHAAFGVVMSKLLYDVVQKRLAGDLPAIVDIVPVGVDLNEMQRETPYLPWQPGELCRIYSCGRLNAIKGHDKLVDAVMMLRKRGIDCHLTIAGEDEQGGSGYRHTLERFISDRGAEARVTLLGAVPETEHRAQLSKAHIFALASENEGISVAIMESMAMQTPVIVTDVGGNSELVINGDNGVLVTYGKPEEMAAAMEKVLRNPEFALDLSKSSRRRVDEKFNATSTALKLFDCLKRSRAGSGNTMPFRTAPGRIGTSSEGNES